MRQYQLPKFVRNWLDELTPEARDRVVTAPRFFSGDSAYEGYEGDMYCGCLVGTAYTSMNARMGRPTTEDEWQEACELSWPVFVSHGSTVAQWFPDAVRRHGYDTVVTAIKEYLARDNPRVEATVSVEPEVAVV